MEGQSRERDCSSAIAILTTIFCGKLLAKCNTRQWCVAAAGRHGDGSGREAAKEDESQRQQQRQHPFAELRSIHGDIPTKDSAEDDHHSDDDDFFVSNGRELELM